jgi:hypothetical protein
VPHGLGLTAQVKARDAYVGGRFLLELAALGGESGAQHAMPFDDVAQCRLEPVDVPDALDLVVDVARDVAHLDRVATTDKVAALEQGQPEAVRLRCLCGQVGDQLCLDGLDSSDELGIHPLLRSLQAQVRARGGNAEAARLDLPQDLYMAHASATSVGAVTGSGARPLVRKMANSATVRSPRRSSSRMSTPVFSRI